MNLSDDLILRAKRAALEADTTLTGIIANSLREALAKPHRRKAQKKTKLITYGKGGVHPEVDLDGTSAELSRVIARGGAFSSKHMDAVTELH